METSDRNVIMTRVTQATQVATKPRCTQALELLPSPAQAFVAPFNTKFDGLLCYVFIVCNVLIDIILLYLM